ncbi:MAG TPA: transcriptional regulator [Archaeoglobus profundus]|nr:transcriptional regulator [Archaeoglobus profundus]
MNITNDFQKLLKIVARNGAPDILFSLNKEKMQFSHLMFKTRLNPGVLNRHLKALMGLGIVEKVDGKYTLTETGKKLTLILKELIDLTNDKDNKDKLLNFK